MLPHDFVLLAGRLVDQEPNPAGFRSCVSRSYYAAYHTALAFLRSLSVTLPKKDRATLHTQVTRILSDTPDEKMNAIGYQIGVLRDQRNAADYDLHESEPESENFARLRLEDATHILTFLNTCRTSPDPAIAESIRKRANVILWGTEEGI